MSSFNVFLFKNISSTLIIYICPLSTLLIYKIKIFKPKKKTDKTSLLIVSSFDHGKFGRRYHQNLTYKIRLNSVYLHHLNSHVNLKFHLCLIALVKSEINCIFRSKIFKLKINVILVK